MSTKTGDHHFGTIAATLGKYSALKNNVGNYDDPARRQLLGERSRNDAVRV